MTELLKKLGLSIEEFAAEFGYSIKTVMYWCGGGVMVAKHQRRISKRLGWKTQDIQDYLEVRK